MPPKKLSDYLKLPAYDPNLFGPGFASFANATSTRTLPNGGGTYQAPTVVPVKNTIPPPVPVEQTNKPLFPQAYWGTKEDPLSTLNQNPVYTNPGIAPTQVNNSVVNTNTGGGGTAALPQKYLFNNGVVTKSPTGSYVPPTADGLPPTFINPKTGAPYSVQEFVDNVANRMVGDVPQFAGDQFKNKDQTTEQTQVTAAGLNNARNDIATGTTDPYSVASGSGINYTPAELAAIEKAYAGVYDPAINSALAKLDADQRKQDQIFNTNENIRQWKATTGADSAGGAGSLGLERGADGYVDPNEYVKKAMAYEKSGGSMKKFIANYPPSNYLNPEAMSIPGLIPDYLKIPTDTQSDRTAEVWKELSRPEVQSLSDEEKATIIRGSYGLNPETFGIYGA